MTMRIIATDDPASGTACPRCRHRPTVAFEQVGRTGSLCPRCSRIEWDLRSVRYEFTCKCGRAMGPIYVIETKTLGKYICFACAALRRDRGLSPNPRVKVRYEVWCEGRCGSLQGWLDLAEGKPVEHRASNYWCTPCARAGRGQELFGARPRIVVPVLV